MKQFRRTAALLLTLVTLTLALTVSVSAKKADLTGHTYEIYQIFKGTTSKGEIDKVTWGSAIVGSGYDYSSALVTALKADADCAKYFSSLTTTVAADVADKLDGMVDEHGDAYAFSTVVYQVLNKNGVSGAPFDSTKIYEGGYYLIKDITPVTGVVGGARNMLVLQLTDKPDGQLLEIKNKTNVPELEKTVKNTQNGEDWSHSASYKLGDTVRFRLKCTLGDLLGYSKYRIKFVDNPSEVFDIDTTTINAYYTDTTGNHPLFEKTDDTGYVVNYSPASPRQFTITFENVLNCGVTAGNVITVEYDAVFNGKAGNHENTAHVEYSSDPLNPDDVNPTPDDKTNVHNFTLIVNKVDGKNNPLDGAVFKLEMDNGAGGYEDVSTLGSGTSIHQFKWEGIKAGKYRLTEVSAPTSDSYKPINPVEFEIKPVYYDGNNTMLETLTVVSGSVFTANKDTYEITTTIMNVAGATLPETGGRGTRMFYIAGSVLFLGGAVLLVTKRRMYDPE